MTANLTHINERICKALSLNTSGVARAIGVTAQAYSNRLSRNAVPVDAIHSLCTQHGLSVEWVLTGKGSIYEGGREARRSALLMGRMSDKVRVLDLEPAQEQALVQLLQAVVEGNVALVKAQIRGLSAPASAAERRLVEHYRQADSRSRSLITAIAQPLSEGPSA
jgi:hypothetical protein